MSEESKVAAKRAMTLPEARFALAQHVRQFWVVDAEAGTTIKDVVDPVYWAHVAPKFSPFDRITVQIETGEWMLELLVIDRARNWAKVRVLHEYQLHEEADSAATPESAYEVKWGGNHHKWRVLRKDDNQEISGKHADQESAKAWLRNYELTIANT